ncbi:hypothetical protein, partial [Salmonella enterica]
HVAMPLEGPRRDHPGVAVCLDPAGVGIAPEVEAAVRKAAAILHRAGYEVSWRDPPDVAAAAKAWNDFAQGEARLTLSAQIEQHG